MFKVTLIVKLKGGEIKTLIFDEVSDIYADYQNNRFSIEDFSTGLEYKYHFVQDGTEQEGEVVEILEIKITKEK